MCIFPILSHPCPPNTDEKFTVLPTSIETHAAGVKICVTGILESIEREQAEELVQRYGGTVSKSITKKLSYAVVGRDAGVLCSQV